MPERNNRDEQQEVNLLRQANAELTERNQFLEGAWDGAIETEYSLLRLIKRLRGQDATLDDAIGIGADLIAAERQRQLSDEELSADHDDRHRLGEMAVAAACYAVHELSTAEGERIDVTWFDGGDLKDAWPWEPGWDKREKHSQIRRLTIAGALIAAEIDRLHRHYQAPPAFSANPNRCGAPDPGATVDSPGATPGGTRNS